MEVVNLLSTAAAIAFFEKHATGLRERMKQGMLRVVTDRYIAIFLDMDIEIYVFPPNLAEDRVRSENGQLNEEAGSALIYYLRSQGWDMLPVFIFCGQLTIRVLALRQAPNTYGSVREAEVLRFARFESL